MEALEDRGDRFRLFDPLLGQVQLGDRGVLTGRTPRRLAVPDQGDSRGHLGSFLFYFSVAMNSRHASQLGSSPAAAASARDGAARSLSERTNSRSSGSGSR